MKQTPFARDTDTPLPSAATLDRETIAAHLTLWAAALRAALDHK